MKKISLLLILVILGALLSGCSITVNGKKVVSFNEGKKGVAWPTGNNTAEKTDVKDEEIENQDRISVSNASGKIVLKVWEKDTVHITALKKVKAGGDKAKLEEFLGDIKVDVNKTSNSVDINVKYLNGMWGFNQQSVELEVMVPKKVRYVSANSASGEILASDFNVLEQFELTSVSGTVEAKNTVSKEFEIKTTSGSINIDNVIGNGNVNTISGSIDAKKIIGDTKYNSTSGSIEAVEIEGKADITTISGSINAESNYLKSSEVHSASGSINIQALKIDNNSKYKINSISGDVTLELPQEANFEIDASSTSGSINNEFRDNIDNGGGKKHIKGIVGKGGADIVIHTVSGGIDIIN